MPRLSRENLQQSLEEITEFIENLTPEQKERLGVTKSEEGKCDVPEVVDTEIDLDMLQELLRRNKNNG